MVFHSMRCFYSRAITGRAFFVESADCYFAPLIFLSKLFLQSKYPCPYFVGVNVLMCAMLKREGGKRGREEREWEEEQERAQCRNPDSPYFLLFHSRFSSPSLSLSLPPLFGRAFLRVRVGACACVCVWRVRVCVHECVCSVCVHECVCGVCYFVHFTSQTKIFLCPFLLLYRTVSFFCPSRCEPVTRCSWSGSGRSQNWRTSDCPCHRHRHRLVSTKLNSRFAQISAEQEKLSRQKSTQKKPKGANATILLFFSKENCNCVMKLFSKVKEIASVGGDYVCRKPIIRNNSSNNNNNNI